jgi:hypothetical protein
MKIRSTLFVPYVFAIEAYYGNKVLTTDILITRSVRNPQADPLRGEVAKHLKK